MPKPKPNDIDQFEWDAWLFEHKRPVLTIQETAAKMEMCDNQVRALIEAGQLVAAPINDAAPSDQARRHLRIMRWSVEAWWLNKLEDEGIRLPVRESVFVQHWRQELRKQPGRSLNPNRNLNPSGGAS